MIIINDTRKQNYLHGAMILTISAVIIKILGAIYKIPLYNILQKSGTTDFTAAYNIYTVLLSLSTAGLPVALSRLVSEAHALGRERQIDRTYRVAYAIFLTLGAVGSLIMLLFPRGLAAMVNDIDAANSILALSPAVLLVCLMSAYRGYTQGHSDMIPTAVSQVLEVAIKVALGLAAAWYLSRAGYSSANVSAGAILGVSAGSLVTLIYLTFAKRKIAQKKDRSKFTDTPDSKSDTFFALIKICLPIILSSSVISVIALIDSGLTLGRLQNGLGLTLNAAKEINGEYAYTKTISDLPSTFTTALSIAVVPTIAALAIRKRGGDIQRVAESAFRVATIIILPMGIGMAALAKPILNTLYFGKITEIGPTLMFMMGIAVYFINMSLMTNAVIQAGGHERLPIISMAVGTAVKVILGWILIGDPAIGIYGAPLSTIGCYLAVCGMNLIFLRRALGGGLRLGRVILRPAIACAAMGLTAWAVYGLLDKFITGGVSPGRMTIAFCMAGAIAAAVVVYLVIVVLIKAVTADDLKLMPKGDKIANLLKIK